MPQQNNQPDEEASEKAHWHGSASPTGRASLGSQTDQSANSPDVVSGPDDIGFISNNNGLLQRPVDFLLHWQDRLIAALGEEEAYGARFLFIPVFAGIGTIFYFCAVGEPSWLRLCLFAILFFLLSRLFRTFRGASLSFLFFACAALGALSAKVETARFSTRIIATDAISNLTGRVTALEAQANGSYRIVMDVLSSQNPVLAFNPEQVSLSARKLPEGVVIGSGLEGLVQLRVPSGPTRVGGYDFAFHNYYRGIGAQGYFMGAPRKIEVAPPENWLKRIQISVAKLRALMTKRIMTAIEGEAGAVSAALITGQRGGITAETNEALRHSGLAHILSISGLHMAMVTGMVLVVMRAILALFPLLSSRRSPKKIAAGVALCISAFYLMLSGADVAAQRSFIMVAVMLVAVLFDRAAITMRNLAISALITIIIVPHELLGPSFQMSFAATAALIAAFGWWSERRRKRIDEEYHQYGFLMKLAVLPVVSTGVASLVAGTASGIYAAFHFNNTAPLGILSNALSFPVMSIAVMPFALLAAVLMPLHLEWLPLQIMGRGVELVKKIAIWVADMSPDINLGAIPPSALVFLSIGLVILLFMRTWLRLTAVLPLMIGIWLCFIAPLPLAFIAEDGRMAGVVLTDHALAVSRPRPQAFTLNNWLAALGMKKDNVILPQEKGEGDGAFVCEGLSCRIRLENTREATRYFTLVQSPSVLDRACAQSDIVFINYVDSSYMQCAGAKLVITRRDLALYGMAEIHYMRTGDYKIIWASGLPDRPWNRHRLLSKAARGML